LALLNKQETLCLELGNKDGLAYCYWNTGTGAFFAREQRDRNTERESGKRSLPRSLFSRI
jgi:hypothetical protein